MSQQPPQPAVTNDERTAAVNGDGQLFHGNLDGAFYGGNGVGHCQFFTGKVVVQNQPSFLCHSLCPVIHASGAQNLSRVKSSQNLI